MLGAAGAGAALMYFLDPQRGRRRRVLARDKVNRITHKTTGTVGATSRDLRNRALGIMAETRSLVSRRQVSDEVLAERVRARLGSLVSHASSIQVWSDNGRITLSGGVVAAELPRLIRGVSSIRGVTGVENLLTVQETAESLSGHYGKARWPESGSTLDKLRKPWTETTRFLMGAFGSIFTFGGAVCRSINGVTMTLVGAALLTAALSTSRSWFWRFGVASESGAGESAIPHHHNGAGGTS
ncbi:MAG TPA: BON domain-containing protein [Candidatus Binatia bacterium]|nr:BON domain-containing protein [Candidatus Binatia bacterium]